MSKSFNSSSFLSHLGIYKKKVKKTETRKTQVKTEADAMSTGLISPVGNNVHLERGDMGDFKKEEPDEDVDAQDFMFSR